VKNVVQKPFYHQANTAYSLVDGVVDVDGVDVVDVVDVDVVDGVDVAESVRAII
jgi:hypothetical protein